MLGTQKRKKRGKIERRLRRKVLEDPGPKLPAPPPSLRGAPNRASEVTAERLLAGTGAPRDRRDKTPGATAALTVVGEEPGGGASLGQGSQQQEAPKKRRL